MTPQYRSFRSEQFAGLSTSESLSSGDAIGSANRIQSLGSMVTSCSSSSITVVQSNGAPKSKSEMSAAAASSGVGDLKLRNVIKQGKSKIVNITASEHRPARVASSPAIVGDDMANSAPSVLIRAPSESEPLLPIRSIMSARNIEESLHRRRTSDGARFHQRGVSFANVNIREYERVLGDNPSVRSGPPISIGWRYSPSPLIMSIEDFETGKGPPRSSAEFCVPKIVRESMLKEHAEVSRPMMAAAVRVIQKDKAQRRKTVVNLGMAPVEEKIEGIKRKVRSILRPSTSYSNLEARLWDEAQARAVEKARTLEDSIERGRGVSARELWSVGTPQDLLLPSRRNTTSGPTPKSQEPKPQEPLYCSSPPGMDRHKTSDRRNETKTMSRTTTPRKTNTDPVGVESGTTLKPDRRLSGSIVAVEPSDSESEEEILTTLRIDDCGDK